MQDSGGAEEADLVGTAGKAEPLHHLVGGGIASLAAATFLIRDAGVRGDRISIYEQSGVLGGSLDGGGSAQRGYTTRGGRMFERHFVCTFDLLSSIPSLESPATSVKDDIEAFNLEVVGSSRCRLIRCGQRLEQPALGLGARDLLELGHLLIRPERSLAGAAIDDCFSDGFFRTNFWIMWSTTFAFAPWHSAIEFKRYLRRFIHLLPEFGRLGGVLRTRYNQYDSLIAPIVAWLKTQGVRFYPKNQVTDLDFACREGIRTVTALHLLRDGRPVTLPVSERDRVFLTLGSMTECSSLGSTSAPPAPAPIEESGAWQLWRKLAAQDRSFGDPGVFTNDVGRTRWESFTVTFDRPDFFDFMQSLTGNVAGTGGLVTFADSNWLMSIVLFHQPHFSGQPDNVYVLWGNGLFPDRPGNHVPKPMSACSGGEILQELAGHLRLGDQAARLLGDAVTIPCLMPFITSQFMPRSPGDRPPVILQHGSNLALMGQFCEMPDDVVFTVEYSVRSAMTAVYSLLDVRKEVPGVRRTDRQPAVLLRAVKALLSG